METVFSQHETFAPQKVEYDVVRRAGGDIALVLGHHPHLREARVKAEIKDLKNQLVLNYGSSGSLCLSDMSDGTLEHIRHHRMAKIFEVGEDLQLKRSYCAHL